MIFLRLIFPLKVIEKKMPKSVFIIKINEYLMLIDSQDSEIFSIGVSSRLPVPGVIMYFPKGHI